MTPTPKASPVIPMTSTDKTVCPLLLGPRRSADKLPTDINQISTDIVAKRSRVFFSYQGDRIDIGDVFSHGSWSAVRTLKVTDQAQQTLFVAKEIPLTRPIGHNVHQLGYNKYRYISGFKVMQVHESKIRHEVAMMMAGGSTLTPHHYFRVLNNQLEVDRIFLALPCMSGTALEAVNHFKEQSQLLPAFTVRLMRDLSAGLAHLHRRGISLRDIKLENVLLDPMGQAVLSDFGMAQRGASANQFCGTTCYGAPEALAWGTKGVAKKRSAKPYRLEGADLWGLGASLAHALIGENLFHHRFWQQVNLDRDPEAQTSSHTEVIQLRRTLGLGLIDLRLFLAQDQQKPYPKPGGQQIARFYDELFSKDPQLAVPILLLLAPDPNERPTAQKLSEEQTSLWDAPRLEADRRLQEALNNLKTPATEALLYEQRKYQLRREPKAPQSKSWLQSLWSALTAGSNDGQRRT